MTSSMRKTLSANLRAIMADRDLSEAGLSQMTGGEVGQKTINNLKNQRQSAGLDTIEHIARALRIDPLLLLQEGLADDLSATPSVSKLYRAYTKASLDGRQMIAAVAEREAEYSSKKAS